jgi:hypothetical protein
MAAKSSLQSTLDGIIHAGRHVMQVRVYYEDTDFSGLLPSGT